MYQIITHDNAKDELLMLSEPMKGRMFVLIEKLKQFGPQLGMPHSKALGGGLFELRTQGKDIARCIYVFQSGKRIFLLNTFVKKTQQTPAFALATARKRLEEMLND
ncbi:type II toxin-antitoxin system RelE/ParE family toxin [Orbaceae bacterium ac157xtp]